MHPQTRPRRLRKATTCIALYHAPIGKRRHKAQALGVLDGYSTNLPSMLPCVHSCRRILTLLMGLRVLCATASTCISQSQLSHPSDS